MIGKTGRTALVGILIAAGLTACATLPQGQQGGGLSILFAALATPVEELQALADKNDANAQYALAVLHQYGLRGFAKDEVSAIEYKRKAVASRGYTSITQYIAGLNGKPGRTAIINVPKHGVNKLEAVQVVDACAEVLASGQTDTLSQQKCGDAQTFEAFSALWAAGLSTPAAE